MDLVVSALRRPKAGETILGNDFQTSPGGKGANQAVAAARLGAEVHMIGCIGNDEFGSELKTFLERETIFLNGVEPVTGISSGVALITIAEADNSIIVVPGTNKLVTPEYVRKYEEQIATSDIVLTQLEIPIESVEEIARLCYKHQTPLILNPAPAMELNENLIKLASYITPNEIELAYLEKTEIELSNYPEKLIVTQGKDGVIYHDGDGICKVPSFIVPTVDTTGAGDTFNGAFAYAISKNKNVKAACNFANAAAALSVQKMGAQGGMPTKDEVNKFLRAQGIANAEIRD